MNTHYTSTPPHHARSAPMPAMPPFHGFLTEHQTAEQASEQKASRSENRLALSQAVIDEMPGGVFVVWGPELRLGLINQASATFWGTPWLPGQPMRDFLATNGIQITNMDGHPFALEQSATWQVMQTGEPVIHHQSMVRYADGTTVPVLCNGVPLDPSIVPTFPEDGSGSAQRGVLVSFQDVNMFQDTSIFKAAEQLKDDFIGEVVHELRNPLAVLKGLMGLLIHRSQRDQEARLADWLHEVVESMNQSVERLTMLTNDLLDVTRLQAGGFPLQCEPQDLVALEQRVIRQGQLTTQTHPLLLDAPAEPIMVLMDAMRIEQVLTNLLSNAIKYSPAGGDVVTTLRVDREQGIVQCQVRDHGIGIPADQQQRIFTRFGRAENAVRHHIPGTGLGLYLCAELIERHHGKIWFESSEGQGTTFTFTLPLASSTSVQMSRCNEARCPTR